MIKYLVVLSIIFNFNTAFCVIHVDSYDKAPYAGFLFTEEEAQDVRTKILDLNDLKAINDSYQHSIDLYKANQNLYSQQVSILLEQNKKLIETQQTTSSLSTYEKIGYFALGVLATGISYYVAEKALANR